MRPIRRFPTLMDLLAAKSCGGAETRRTGDRDRGRIKGRAGDTTRSLPGQNAKYSPRVDVVRSAYELGHCAMRSALRICAMKRLMHRSKNKRNFDQSCGAPNAAVDLAAQRPEVDRFG